MKIHVLLASLFLCVIPLHATAGWEVSKPESAIPREPFFQAGNQQNTAFLPSAYSSSAFPNQYADLGQPAAIYAVSISGSLKENLERIMGRYHWKVIWKAPYDYNFDGRVTGSSLPNVVEKLLQPFPLQAVMYMSNRTLAVVPRYRT
ncbi:TcpQ domain-containing protein [Aquicella siphonis]|nr:TcpQ domain-containing protein [Aquicella siphonis]